MINQAPLTGSRLQIVQLGPAEMDDSFVAMYSNEDGRNDHFRKSGDALTQVELQAFCARGIEEDNCFYFAVRTLEDNQLVGSIRLGVIDRKNGTSDLVTLIGHTANRGRGYGSEAVGLGNRAAFERHGVRKLHSSIMADNVASLRAYLRAGWVEEGTLREHLIVNGKPMDLVLVSCFGVPLN
jgi:ribosomal-protein-alanine N-acetyltransferase